MNIKYILFSLSLIPFMGQSVSAMSLRRPVQGIPSHAPQRSFGTFSGVAQEKTHEILKEGGSVRSYFLKKINTEIKHDLTLLMKHRERHTVSQSFDTLIKRYRKNPLFDSTASPATLPSIVIVKEKPGIKTGYGALIKHFQKLSYQAITKKKLNPSAFVVELYLNNEGPSAASTYLDGDHDCPEKLTPVVQLDIEQLSGYPITSQSSLFMHELGHVICGDNIIIAILEEDWPKIRWYDYEHLIEFRADLLAAFDSIQDAKNLLAFFERHLELCIKTVSLPEESRSEKHPHTIQRILYLRELIAMLEEEESIIGKKN